MAWVKYLLFEPQPAERLALSRRNRWEHLYQAQVLVQYHLVIWREIQVPLR
jgi:hypothetical protein